MTRAKVGSLSLQSLIPGARRRTRMDRIVRLWVEELDALGDRLRYLDKYPRRAGIDESAMIRAAVARHVGARLEGGIAVRQAARRVADAPIDGPEDAFGRALVEVVLEFPRRRWTAEELPFAAEGVRAAEEALARLTSSGQGDRHHG